MFRNHSFVKSPRCLVVAAIATALAAHIGVCEARASDWRWPSQMSIAKFKITRIAGGVRSDGSGTATGMLRIPGAKDQKISLTRSTRGKVTGAGSLNLKVSRTELKGKFTLTSAGLKGKGTLKTAKKAISYSRITAKSDGLFIGIRSITVKDQQDTPLATYRFEGKLNFKGKLTRIKITADGTVRRSGKLANKTTTHRVAKASVNTSNGRCAVNIGGVKVTFKLL